MAKIQAIYRYPIKGLSPERLDRAALAPRQTIPGDRVYAIENGPSDFDPAATNIDPVTAMRNLSIPQTLTFGHADCGVYAEVIEGVRLPRGCRPNSLIRAP